MGTRKFCDHCGNTVTDHSKIAVLSYGDLHQQIRDAYMGVAGGYSGPMGGASRHEPKAPVIDVELCPHCLPIWLERVKKLTAAADDNV